MIRVCIGGCGLLAAPGDVFCPGCRGGFDRDPDSIVEWAAPERLPKPCPECRETFSHIIGCSVMDRA